MANTLRVGILGHWGANIGHDLMALGVECLLEQALAHRSYETRRFEQHRQFSVYGRWHPLQLMHLLTYKYGDGLKRLVNRPTISAALWRTSAVKNIALAVACGGPYITPAHYASGEIGLMLQHMHGAFTANAVPLFNFSIGSCYPQEHIPTAMDDPQGRVFLRRMLDLSTVNTVRDQTAQNLTASVGVDCPLLPCPSIVGGRAFEKWNKDRSPSDPYIILNYQERGANEDWGQNVDTAAWQTTFQTLVGRLRQRHKLIFVCHNQREDQLAAALAPDVPRFSPRTEREYAELVSGAVTGLVSRVHAALPLAAVGVSAILIGTDTRLGVAQTAGLPTFYVKNATADLLEAELENRIRLRQQEAERLQTLRENTAQRYSEFILEKL